MDKEEDHQTEKQEEVSLRRWKQALEASKRNKGISDPEMLRDPSLQVYSPSHSLPSTTGVKDSNGDLATSSESAAKHCGGGAKAGGVSGREGSSVRLQRENVRLQDQLRSSEELNTTLRSELDLHRSILDQNQAHNQVQNHAGPGPEPQKEAQIGEGLSGTQQATAQQHNMNPGTGPKSDIVGGDLHLEVRGRVWCC